MQGSVEASTSCLSSPRRAETGGQEDLNTKPVPRSATKHQDERGGRSCPAASPSKGKGKATEIEVTDSFLKRLCGLAGNKAGLKRDPEDVRKIIYEASKGSAFAINEQNRDAATTKQIQAMLSKLEAKVQAMHGDLSKEEAEVDRRIAYLEITQGSEVGESVVVIDADAFYASVEELDNPELKGKPFGVGSGVLTTASYEARKYGCRSAMAGFVAKKLCPHLIFVKPDFKKYSAASKKIMDILRRYDENMAPASLDEAYLNITAYLQRTGQSSTEVVTEMRAAVKAETGLTVSAGIAPNKMLAKIAADVNKPDGQCLVPSNREAMMAFIQPLSVRKIPGVGRVNERWLEALDVIKIADIYTQRSKLNLVRNQIGLDFLLKAYLGLGSSHVEPGKREDRKSVGRETTFSTISDQDELYSKLKETAENVANDLERLQFSGRTITLKLKEDTYEPMTRGHTDSRPTYYSSFDDLYRIGKELLEKELQARRQRIGSKDLRLRLLGLRVTNLRDELNRKEVLSLDQWAKPLTPEKKRKQSEGPEVPPSLEETDKATLKPAKSTVKLVSPLDEVLEKVDCPLCARHFDQTSTSQFNHHLDTCLDTSAVLEQPNKKQKLVKIKPKQQSAFSVMMLRAQTGGSKTKQKV